MRTYRSSDLNNRRFGIVNAFTRPVFDSKPDTRQERRIWATVVLIGQRIRSFRQIKGLSLPALAEKAKVSKGYLWRLENGEDPNPSLAVLARIAEALDTTVAELLGQEIVK